MEETRNKTNLTKLNNFDNWNFSGFVNLEKSLKLGDFIGGHILTGHVDMTATIREVINHSDGSRSIWLNFGDYSIKNLVVQKGHIAVDGVSLTIAEIRYNTIRISLIPFTLQNTNLQLLNVGDFINVEFDQDLKRRENINSKNNLNDQIFMEKAITLGECGRATAPPNPWVGCVIVDESGFVIGNGFHKKTGKLHAEAIAINAAIDSGFENRLTHSTLYTTLEPCSHFGRTPPCANLILRHKIKRVVIAVLDPDVKVNGLGLKILMESGVQVTCGIMEKEARESLKAYLYHRQTGLPWTILKIACSLDGKIAAPDGTSKWITGEKSRLDAHQRFRATSQAIIIGTGTAAVDDPTLTARALPDGTDAMEFSQPLRVVVGNNFNLGKNLLNTNLAPTVICTTKDNEVNFDPNIKVIQTGTGRHPDFLELLKELGQLGCIQVLIEGGATFGSIVLSHEYVYQLVIYQAPKILGENSRSWCELSHCETISQIKTKWRLLSQHILDDDICVEYEIKK